MQQLKKQFLATPQKYVSVNNMSVKIFYSEKIATYNPEQPLQAQLKGCKKVVINYEPKDHSIAKFVDEIERLCDRGNSTSLNIDIVHNNNIMGAKLKKRLEKAETDIHVNQLITLLVVGHSETDKKLEQMVKLCSEGTCRVRQKA